MNTRLIIPALLLIVLAGMSGCEKAKIYQYDIYENHNISACGVNDPLQNIDWLKEYCRDIKGKKNISPVYISLFKVIDKEEYVFNIDVPSSVDYASNKYYQDCKGDTVFRWLGDLVHADPNRYYEFMEDKEFVAELFHFVKQ
jgi:hypothetical protein